MQEKEANKSNIEDICLHCSTPLLPGQNKFCCIGCEFVFGTISSLGLKDYYRKKLSDTDTEIAKINPNQKFEYLDNNPEIAQHIKKINNDVNQVCFYLPTIHCRACVWLIEKIPEINSNIKLSRVNYSNYQCTLQYSERNISLSEIAGLLNSLGYPPVIADDNEIIKIEKIEERSLLIKIGIAGFAAANTMMLSDAIFADGFINIEKKYQLLFLIVSAVLTLPVVTFCSFNFYQVALGGLLIGAIHIDLPVSIAIIASYILDIRTIITGGNEVYFDSITCLVFLLLSARYMQKKALFNSRATSASIWELLPNRVEKVSVEKTTSEEIKVVSSEHINAKDINIGDFVSVNAGDRIPFDGIIVSGNSAIDRSFLTGERMPIQLSRGDEVFAGSINIDAKIVVEVNKNHKSSKLSDILKRISELQSNKSKFENSIDIYSRYLTILVIILSVATFLVWHYLIGDSVSAYKNSLALLVVTCPCALGLAIPATLTIALKDAQKNRIFIKNSEAILKLNKINSFYFDKTGTLTLGKMKVVDTLFFEDHSNNLSHDLSHDLSIYLDLADNGKVHPISQAIYEYLVSIDIKTKGHKLNDRDINYIPGKGITLTTKNICYRLGSLKWLESAGINIPEELRARIEEAHLNGQTVSCTSKDNTLTGIFMLEDILNIETAKTISLLQSMNREIFILSGDNQQVVESVASKLSIKPTNAIGDLYPEDKYNIITSSNRSTCMIGDGINDILAIKSADVGIALKGGIESAVDSADIFLAQNSMQQIYQLLIGAKNIDNVIKRNLVFSAIYNLTFGSLAILGFITPLHAAILMPLSSIFVILSSVMGRYFSVNQRA